MSKDTSLTHQCIRATADSEGKRTYWVDGTEVDISEQQLATRYTDNHLVSWQEVVKGGQHRLVTEECAAPDVKPIF